MSEPKARPQLHGFFEEVTLSTGATVRIRKVDLQANQQSTYREMLSAAIAKAGAENASEGARLLSSIMEGDTRPEDLVGDLAAYPDLIIGMEHRGHVSLLERACVTPKLDELIEWYEGDRALPDLGLGPDFHLLLTYVRQHSKVGTATALEVAEARVFPDGVGRDAGQPVEAVRETTE